MAAKTAFMLASYQLRVSEDWVVADAVDRNRSLGTGNFLKISGQNRLLDVLMAANHPNFDRNANQLYKR
jgi:hypothetical protein